MTRLEVAAFCEPRIIFSLYARQLEYRGTTDELQTIVGAYFVIPTEVEESLVNKKGKGKRCLPTFA
jgi:hypothetical protein